MSKWAIEAAEIVTPDDIVYNSSININDDKISGISSNTRAKISVDLSDCVVCPGLINAHDHLLGTYYPKVGNGPYPNWLPWDNDLKSSPVYRERQQIENRDLYLLGAFRNLISGVTSVQDHIPHFVQDPFIEILPIKVISDFAMAHSITSFALPWGDGVEVEYKKAKKNKIPFVTHIAEGFDEETIEDIKTLNNKGALGEYSVLVHGLAFSEKDIELISEKGASVVWCADSNMFMFNRTANVEYLLEAGVNVCIGTDSPMSGGENLLHEMKYDRELYPELFGKKLLDRQIVKMVTENPAKAFKLNKNGKIATGYLADLVAFSKQSDDPYTSIVNAKLADVNMVVINGNPIYANKEFSYIFDQLSIKYQEINVDSVDKIIAGDLIGLLERINKAVRFKKKFPFMPVKY